MVPLALDRSFEMKRFLLILAATLALSLGGLLPTSTAEARWGYRGYGYGGGYYAYGAPVRGFYGYRGYNRPYRSYYGGPYGGYYAPRYSAGYYGYSGSGYP